MIVHVPLLYSNYPFPVTIQQFRHQTIVNRKTTKFLKWAIRKKSNRDRFFGISRGRGALSYNKSIVAETLMTDLRPWVHTVPETFYFPTWTVSERWANNKRTLNARRVHVNDVLTQNANREHTRALSERWPQDERSIRKTSYVFFSTKYLIIPRDLIL